MCVSLYTKTIIELLIKNKCTYNIHVTSTNNIKKKNLCTVYACHLFFTFVHAMMRLQMSCKGVSPFARKL